MSVSNADAARFHLERLRWPDGPACPTCGETRRIWTDARRPGLYRCNVDLQIFSVRTDTILERSKVPLDKWLHVLRLPAAERTSSTRLARAIGVTQKTAWYMAQRIGEALAGAEDDPVARVLAYRAPDKALATHADPPVMVTVKG